ncbi:MAG: sigma-70 family RNA polymerase sigma factor [Eubacterium sp.]|nr:sigma-70 family RNA polymerase sigma factor [Eubacterium sp.]
MGKKKDAIEGLTDEQLFREYRNGNAEVEEILLRRYKKTVRNLAGELYLAGGDREDLIQEGMLGLLKAVREYDPEKGASFQTFARLLVLRQMYSAIEASGRQKHRVLNTSISITELEEMQEDSRLGMADSPENIVLGNENMQIITGKIRDSLSPMENRVLDLYMEGRNYAQIAQILEKTPKSVDNALQRIRAKVAKLAIFDA